MIKRLARFFSWVMGGLCFVTAVGVGFFAPVEDLERNGGIRNAGGGDLFRGLSAMAGEGAARLFLAAVFVALGILFWGLARHRRRSRTHAG